MTLLTGLIIFMQAPDATEHEKPLQILDYEQEAEKQLDKELDALERLMDGVKAPRTHDRITVGGETFTITYK